MAVGEWDRRELCPDGACTGLIGPEGTCKVCGRAAPNWGDERKRGTADGGDDDENADDGEYEDDDSVDDPIAPAAKAQIGSWNDRSLCPDGTCIGLIGPDGTCKVCGKASVPGGAEEGAEEGADEDEDDEDEDDEDEDDELAAAAHELAGVAPRDEVESARDIAGTDDDAGDRKLCPDGGCIGLIGDDGKCKVCGKEAAA